MTANGEIILPLTLSQFQKALMHDRKMITKELAMAHNAEKDQWERVLAENKRNQVNLVASYKATIANQKIRIQRLGEARGKIPDEAIKEGQTRIVNESLPQYKKPSNSQSQVVFPLRGFSGTRVRANLWDETTQQWVSLGEKFEPSELIIENVNLDQWSWLELSEYDEETAQWVNVHGMWISF